MQILTFCYDFFLRFTVHICIVTVGLNPDTRKDFVVGTTYYDSFCHNSVWNSEMKDVFSSKRTGVLQFLMWTAEAIVRNIGNYRSYKETLRKRERCISVGHKKVERDTDLKCIDCRCSPERVLAFYNK